MSMSQILTFFGTDSPNFETPSLTARYLTDYSPKDKPWDVHRAQAQQVEGLYQQTVYDGLAGRIRGCTGYLGFGWEV